MSGALAEINAEFLSAHLEARKKACAQLEADGLVIGYWFGTLEARWKGRTILARTSLLPPEYHPIKDVTHGVTMLVALLAGAPDRERVTRADATLGSVLAELDAEESPAAQLIPAVHRARQRRMVLQARQFLGLLSKNGGVTDEEQKQYFASIREDVRANIEAIAGAVLRELHERVSEVHRTVEKENPRAWEGLVVVASAVHQARADEIAVQYFERLLGEQMAEGASAEGRLIVTEGMSSPADQYGLLATHLVDVASAQRVFGDARRLQRDVLADEYGGLDRLLSPPKDGAKRGAGHTR